MITESIGPQAGTTRGRQVSANLWQRLAPWRRGLRVLDGRSLALLRIGLALVMLWDISLAWPLADDWLAMQAFDVWPLPIGLNDAALSLRVALMLYALAALAFLCGWRTPMATLLVWLCSCGFQYASRYSADYHNAILCQLLLWSIALPLGRRWSVDAFCCRQFRVPVWLQNAAATGLLVTIAWIYLSTALAKDGVAWWSDGNALRLAISDRAVMRDLGQWWAQSMPTPILQGMTWLTLVVEVAVPLLILAARRRARTVAALALVGLHLGMAALMNLGSFPLLMLSVAAVVWLPWKAASLVPVEPALQRNEVGQDPASKWSIVSTGCEGPGSTCVLPSVRQSHGSVGLEPPSTHKQGSTGSVTPPGQGHGSSAPGWWWSRALAGVLAVNLLLTLDAERQIRWPVEPDTSVARWLRRGRTFLGAEPVWGMYAPEPWRFTGWWVGVGETVDGQIIDPMTQAAPVLMPPGTADPLRWAYLWNPPSAIDPAGVETAGTEDAYLRFLLRRQQQAPAARQLRWLGLIYVYEPLEGSLRGQHFPLLARRWPVQTATSTIVTTLGVDLYAVDVERFGDPQWRPQPLAFVP